MQRAFPDGVWRKINWQSLSEEITSLIPDDEHFAFAGAFAKNTYASRRSKKEIMSSGFEVLLRPGKDIDAWIVTKINNEIFKILDLVPIGNRFVSGPIPDINIFIVSGDGLYWKTIQNLKYSIKIKIKLTVFSWRDSCSRVLQNSADKLVYLDDIPDITLT